MNCDPVIKPITEVNLNLPRVGEGELLEGPAKDTENPLPLRTLLTRLVVVSIANYCMIGLLKIMGGSLILLVWSTSVEFGGLGMSPASIGLWIAGYGFLNGIFQFLAFPRIVGRFRPWRVFGPSTFCVSPIYTLLPFESLALRHSARDPKPAAALLIVLQLMMMCFSGMGFGKFPRTFHCAWSLKWCESVSCDIYVHIFCLPQAVPRRYKWNRPDDGLDSAHGQTSCCHVTFCILIGHISKIWQKLQALISAYKRPQLSQATQSKCKLQAHIICCRLTSLRHIL